MNETAAAATPISAFGAAPQFSAVLIWSARAGTTPCNQAGRQLLADMGTGEGGDLGSASWRTPDDAGVPDSRLPWVRAALWGEAVLGERLLVRIGGRERALTIEASPLALAGAERASVITLTADVPGAPTSEAVRSRDRLGRVLERTGDEVYIFDAHSLALVQVNRAARTASGTAPESGQNPSILDVLVGLDRPGLGSLLTPLLAAEVERVRLPTTRRRMDRSPHPVEVVLVPVAGEFPPLVAAIVADISGRAAAEHRLRRRERHARRRANEHSAVRRVAVAVARGRSLQDICEMVSGEVRRMFGARSAAVVRFIDGDALRAVAGSTAPGAAPTFPDRAGLGEVPVAERIFHSGEPEVVPEGMLAVPIQAGGVLWGALGVSGIDPNPERVPIEGRVGRLRRFAEMVGIAVVGTEARDRMAELAATDHLTGLANRRAFQERLAQEVERARRHRRDLALVLMDVDHFKQVNDQLGHQVGDAVLQEVARRLERLARRSDMVARLGGDEFAWLMPEGGGLPAWRAADRARLAIAAEPLPGVGQLTISAGVCELDQGMDGQALVRAADEALYRAKRHGRDVALVHGGGPTPVGEPLSTADLTRARVHQGLRALARAVDGHHPSTAHHSEQVAEVVAEMARELDWPDGRVAALVDAALLQNVGCLAVPDCPIMASSPLGGHQLAQIRRHPQLSADMVAQALTAEQAGWIRAHHEWWDGGGYPRGLVREHIPVAARLLALAEAWVAMTSARPWRPARTPTEALAECRRHSGGQFWPEAVQALGEVVAAGRIGGGA